MSDREILELAEKCGFAESALIDTDRIPTDAGFRKYCEENLCGQYDAGYACPPHCGSPEQMRQKLLSRSRAAVLKSAWPDVDFSDGAGILKAKKAHNEMEMRMQSEMERCGHHGFIIGSSRCSLCPECGFSTNTPCPFPEKMYSCVSAYCIAVGELAGRTGMTYSWNTAELNLWGLYIFD